MAQQPMYQQIAEKLRAQIESGELAPGDQLPTELELATGIPPRGTPSGTRSSG